MRGSVGISGYRQKVGVGQDPRALVGQRLLAFMLPLSEDQPQRHLESASLSPGDGIA